jgi:hypothetical protein
VIINSITNQKKKPSLSLLSEPNSHMNFLDTQVMTYALWISHSGGSIVVLGNIARLGDNLFALNYEEIFCMRDV